MAEVYDLRGISVEVDRVFGKHCERLDVSAMDNFSVDYHTRIVNENYKNKEQRKRRR